MIVQPLDLFTRRQVLSVSELVNQLKKATEQRFDFVWVRGEISGLRRPGSGHLYFTLKDERAALRAVLFRQQAALLRFALEEGQEVLCQGRLSVYPPRGEVQLVVEVVEAVGAGALALAFEQVKKRLAAEGLFDPERKRPLPDFLERVAVITSPQGAALRDFLHVLHQRWPRIQVAVYPSLVQGAQAAAQMIQALEALAAWGWPQVIVLTRGGGSPEDLAAYNDEALARAIAACPLPVVSAVGHEVDLSISDLVADLRAPTPTAAAELLAQPMAERAARLEALSRRLGEAGRRLLERRRVRLEGLARALGDPRRHLADRRLRVDDLLIRAGQAMRGICHRRARRVMTLAERLHRRRPDRRLQRLAARREQLLARLGVVAGRLLSERRWRLERARTRLSLLGPAGVLERGYALVSDEQGRLLRRADQVRPGEPIEVRLSRGRLRARVEEVLP